jgi:ribonuclease T1
MATHAPVRRWSAAGVVLLAAALCTAAVLARTSGLLPDIVVADLPTDARDVNALIRKGGPFHYDRDGVVFGNREKILPPEPRGYYHEYTVRTPGESSRGARRIICGGPPRQPDACWYTADHYRSFRRIRE